MPNRVPWRLVPRHMASHPIRTGLTIAGLVIAMFLFCFLVSIVTSLQSSITQAAGNRLMVQSKVSLFVDLPRDYQARIREVDGVESISKFQWFGGYYQEAKNMFAQFAVDHEVFFDQYAADMDLFLAADALDGDADPSERAEVIRAFQSERRAAVIGPALVRDFGWKVGDTIPLQPSIFHKSDGTAWEFNVVGVYRPKRSNVDERAMWFRFDYLQETLAQGGFDDLGVGCFAVNLGPGYPPEDVAQGIDRLFENGPQATTTFTEAAFQAGFVSMMGNIPIFVGSIGGAVLFAILFSVINTMLMAAFQRVREGGVLQALGFSESVSTWLLLGESLLITAVGGGIGVALSWLAASGMRGVLASFNLGNYAVEPSTVLLGFAISLGIGFIAGLLPGWINRRPGAAAAIRADG
ncbi:MAG: ABC transporter permease [Planctomycetota bacterium]